MSVDRTHARTPRGPWRGHVLGSALVALVVLASLLPTPAGGRSTATPGLVLHPDLPPPYTDNVSYVSSVDGFPLSYVEWLPAGYSPSASYPFALFLHGVGTDSTWVNGGEGGFDQVTTSLVENASADGFILAGLNTRSSNGFYLNSPCGGPQEQDVLDAIAKEQQIRHVSAVYLIGFSMGSLGALSIAGHHPGMFRGVATAGTITDIFETVAFSRLTHSDPNGLYISECGGEPSPANASIDRVWSYLSVLRFEPQNFSAVPLFVTGGGADTRAPNNFARWEYANVNNTFVNSTCVVAAELGEPPNCTRTIPSLAAANPGQFRWVDVYEPYAPHSAGQLPGASVFGFFEGRVAPGYYLSDFPGAALTPYTPGNPIPPPNRPVGDLGLLEFTILGGAVLVTVAVVIALVRARRA